MASVTPFSPGARPGHRDLSFWMGEVLNELENVRTSPDADAVHDLRVAIRRCRSVAAVMEEVDPDPTWEQMRRVPRKLFRKLGELRDAQVMDEWVKQLAPDHDPVRNQLHAAFHAREQELRDAALHAAEKFDDKGWQHLEAKLRKRARFVRPQSLAAQCLAVERFEEAKDLHTRAQRTDRPKAWHELRIGLKRLRYTVDYLLPEQYVLWSSQLKRLQDLLGEAHDLDVLVTTVTKIGSDTQPDLLNAWTERLRKERSQKLDTYRQAMLGRTSLWNE